MDKGLRVRDMRNKGNRRNTRRILGIGLGLAVIFSQPAYADFLITPLDQNVAGSQGAPGSQNAAGNQGAPGSQNVAGNQNAPGSQNVAGSQGAPGSQNVPGNQGLPGSQNAPGSQGAPGSQNAAGNQGLPGSQNAPGNQGAPGSQNVAGNQGAPGSQNVAGNQNAPGSQNAPGNQAPGAGAIGTGQGQQSQQQISVEAGPGEIGTGQNGAGQNAAGQNGTAQNGSGQSGLGQNGTGGNPAALGASGLSSGAYSTKEPAGAGYGAGQNPQVSTAAIEKPQVAAEGAVLYDVTHDVFLFEKNADKKFFPASTTKLMTALVVLEHADMNDMVTFSKTATTNLESGAVTLKLAEGDKVSVKDCLYALLLKSANEVANGLAEHVAGSVPKFAGLMNAKARELGCTNTNFVNPNGLNHKDHYTTCRDMAKIAKAAFANAALCKIDATMSYKFPATKNVSQARTLTPGHKMLYQSDSRYYPGIVGGKTGYTSLAGNTLVTCVEKDGVRMIAVIMKAKSSHYADTKALLDYGYALNQSAGAAGAAGQAFGNGGKYNRWMESQAAGAGQEKVWMFEMADGSYAKNSCLTIDGEEYTFDANGRMLTGWQYINGTWYCFMESGAMAKNRWMQDQGLWFYLGNDGKMVRNAVIDGKYQVGADGVWRES